VASVIAARGHVAPSPIGQGLDHLPHHANSIFYNLKKYQEKHMPTFYLAEYETIGATGRGAIAIALEPPLAEQVIDITALSQQSDELLPETCIVKIQSDVACSIAIGLDPNATNSARILMAGEPQLLTVPAGAKLKIAVVAAQTNGSTVNSLNTLGALLKIVSSPDDAKKQYDELAKQTEKLEAATKELVGANSVATLLAEINGREHALSVREKDVAALEASLKAKANAIKALA
jgi:hypothetical protein